MEPNRKFYQKLSDGSEVQVTYNGSYFWFGSEQELKQKERNHKTKEFFHTKPMAHNQNVDSIVKVLSFVKPRFLVVETNRSRSRRHGIIDIRRLDLSPNQRTNLETSEQFEAHYQKHLRNKELKWDTV